MNYHIWFVQHS